MGLRFGGTEIASIYFIAGDSPLLICFSLSRLLNQKNHSSMKQGGSRLYNSPREHFKPNRASSIQPTGRRSSSIPAALCLDAT
jgi:hypothetical protein